MSTAHRINDGTTFHIFSYYLTMQNQRIHGSVHISSMDDMGRGYHEGRDFFISYLKDGSSQLLVVSKFTTMVIVFDPPTVGKVPSPNGLYKWLRNGGDPNHLRTGMILQVDCGCCGCSIFPLEHVEHNHPPSSIHVRVDSWAMKKTPSCLGYIGDEILHS